MKTLRILVTLLLALLTVAPLAVAQATGTETVLVLPFDNSTHQPGLEWISEAFPEVLGQRLTSQSLFLIGRDDRRYAFDRLGIPVNLHASRATLYRIASQLDAGYIVLGSYSFDGQAFTARAQVLDMKALRLSADMVESGPLNNLIAIETALAWDVLHQLRPGFGEARATFIERAPAIRLDAFENYIRGVVAVAPAEKVRYLKAALAIDPKYAQANLLLGKTHLATREYEAASASLSKLPASDPSFSEASFLLGLSEYHLGHFERAGAAFQATAEHVPLTEVLNNIGVVENRRGHHDASEYFQKAVTADPAEADYHFNLAIALYRRGDLTGAQKQIREALTRRPNDAEARQFHETLTASMSNPAHPPVSPVPLTRIKSNYDESSYRQIALELQNAIEDSIGKAAPAERASLHLERARAFLASGAGSEAEGQFREALMQEPSNAEASAGLSHALLLESKFSAARQQANESLKLEPTAEAFAVLARVAWHDHDRNGAQSNLQKALALDAENADAKALEAELAEAAQ